MGKVEAASGRRAAKVTKALLLLLFLGSLLIVLAGIQGRNASKRAGFSQEAAFQVIYELSVQVEKDEKEILTPAFASLPEEFFSLGEELLSASWTSLSAEGGEKLSKALEAVEGEKKEALLSRLLYATYLLTGPKVSSSQKKVLSGLAAPEELLPAVLDEGASLPSEVEGMVSSLSGKGRASMLLQAYFYSLEGKRAVSDDSLTAFKKTIREKDTQPTAITMIATGAVSWLWQFIIARGTTVVLFGLVLCLDIVLLMLLMRGEGSWHMDMKWIIILLIVDFLLLFQLLPLAYMVIKAFFPEASFSLETFRRLYTYPLNLDALRNTLIAASATMVFGTLLAFPLAWLVGRTNLYGKKVFRFLFVVTYMVPPYVGAMAWLRLMNPNVGTINQWLRSLFHLGNTPGPLNVYTLWGLIWVLTTFYYPYAFITISRAMEKMDPSLEEASRISGASPLRTVFTVTIPLMMPSLISGALLVFVSAASCYGIPSIIGAPGRVHTVTTRIVEYNALGQQGLNDATGMAIFLMVLAILILFLSDVVLAKRQYITVSGKSVQPAIVDLGRWRWPLTILVSLFAVVVIVIPFATILLTSLKIDVGKSAFRKENFTLANWTTVFGRAETMSCLKNSLLYGAVTATIGILIACVMGYLLQRTRVRGRKIPDFLITLGSGTPSVVIALGLIMTMKGNFGINIYNTAYIMIIAYLIKYMMMGMRTVVSAMSQIHVSLEECSQISGASWLKTMFQITGKLIFPSIAAGWFLIFIPSFYELSMTTLLYSSTTKTIGFQLYEYWTFTSQPMACAMAFGILVIVVALNFVLGRLTNGEFSI